MNTDPVEPPVFGFTAREILIGCIAGALGALASWAWPMGWAI